jgi:hypothetical protein
LTNGITAIELIGRWLLKTVAEGKNGDRGAAITPAAANADL